MINETRIFGFDVVRSIAISLVVVSHFPHFLPRFPLDFLFLNLGFFGVELFFVLSGVLIGTILIKLFERPSEPGALWNFWVRRWLRTVPNYMLFLVLNVTVFAWLFGDREFDWRYFVFMQNFAWLQPQDLMPESWSLTVEEWFYISFPLALLGITKFMGRGRRAILLGIGLYIGAITALRFYATAAFNLGWVYEVRPVVAYRLDAIAYGVLAAYFIRYHLAAVQKHANRLFFCGCLLGLFCAAFSLGVFQGDDIHAHRTYFFSLSSIAFALMLPWFKAVQCQQRTVVAGVTHISVVSYSMYLVHLSFVAPLLAPIAFPPVIKIGLYLALTVALATLTYNYFERPFLNLRKSAASRTESIDYVAGLS